MIGTLESFERVTVPACVVNCYGRVVAWNGAAEEFFGVDSQEALGREWHTVVHTIDTDGCCALCRVRRDLGHGSTASPVSVEVSINGCYERVTMVPVPLSSGVDKSLGFIILPVTTPPVAAVPAPHAHDTTAPIPIRSHVRHLDDDRMIETLTMRERQVLACVVEGYDARTIAMTIGITHATARNYVQRILSKLGARNKAEAVHVALRFNLLAS